MLEGKEWRFEQLRPPNKTLTLAGWHAPHGRERVEPVVRDGVELRHAAYYYQGTNVPTRHVFGSRRPPWQIRGRFDDRRNGKGFAKSKKLEVEQFVDDRVPVLVSWGDITAVTGLITKFDPGWEAEWAVEWTLEVQVDENTYAKKKPKKVKEPVSVDYIADLVAGDLAAMFSAAPSIPSTDIFTSLDSLLSLPTNIAGAFLEKLDSAVSLVTGTVGQFQKASMAVQNLESATFATLSKLLNTSVQLRGTVAGFRGAYTSVGVDAAILRERAADNAAWWKGQTSAEAAMRDLVAQLAGLERNVRIKIRGIGAKSYVVRQGDTWESISTTFYGSPDRAGDIMSANGAGPGSKPIAGVELVLPP
jgi:hypothetical protein